MRKGWGQPSIFNADSVVEELLRQGKSLTDARRGAGTYDRIMAAMDRLRERGAMIAFSATATSQNLDDIISEVIDDPAGDHDLPAVVHDDGSVTLDGETTITELLEDYGFTFRHDAVTTLAGLVLAETGTVPRVGDRIESQGYELTVEGMDAYKLTQIRVTRLEVPAEGPDSRDPAPDH